MRRTVTLWLWTSLVCGLMGALMLPAGEAWADESPGLTEVKTPIRLKMEQVISVDFRETPITDVLRILARMADVDIVISPKVEGTVTATLTDVPTGEILSQILEAHGYGFVTSDNMLRVMPADEIIDVREKIVSRVFRITYADVKEVEKALAGFLSDQGSISANPGTSNIIVSDTESKIKAIQTFVEEIDRITPQIMVEAKIYDISSKDRLDIGVNWLLGTRTVYDGDGIPSGQTNPFATTLFEGATNKATDTEGLLRFGILNDNLDLDVRIQASQEDIRAKLLANPRVMVLDNEEANIKIVEEIPFQELTQTSGGGSIGTTEFREVGVELRVVPHLTREGMIRLLLNPKFKVRTGDVLPVSSGNLVAPQPIIASRETLTTALIRDGQTVVIGGLRKQTVNQQINKVPLLGDLPLLGLLFRSQGEETVNSELVVFITPSLVTGAALTAEESRALDNTVFVTPQLPQALVKARAAE
jgi:type IV pilus assembly protein PilQ